MPYKYESHTRTMNHLNTIKPLLKQHIIPILQELEKQGFEPVIWEGNRTVAEQREKVRLGYSKTMNSKHLHGNAVDIVDKRYLWDVGLDHPFFKALGALVNKDSSLVWGGDWGKGYQRYLNYLAGKTKYFVDVAHVQLNQYNT